jgi:hypothetical protein
MSSCKSEDESLNGRKESDQLSLLISSQIQGTSSKTAADRREAEAATLVGSVRLGKGESALALLAVRALSSREQGRGCTHVLDVLKDGHLVGGSAGLAVGRRGSSGHLEGLLGRGLGQGLCGLSKTAERGRGRNIVLLNVGHCLLVDISRGLAVGVVVAVSAGEQEARLEVGARQRAQGGSANLALQTLVGSGRRVRVGSVVVGKAAEVLLSTEEVDDALLVDAALLLRRGDRVGALTTFALSLSGAKEGVVLALVSGGDAILGVGVDVDSIMDNVVLVQGEARLGLVAGGRSHGGVEVQDAGSGLEFRALARGLDGGRQHCGWCWKMMSR